MTHRSRSLFTATTLLVALLSMGGCSSSGGGGSPDSVPSKVSTPAPDESVVVLAAEQGRDLVTQCARSESAAEAFFTPDAGQVEAADKAIQAFYDGMKTKVSAYWYKDFPTFRRQYVGTVVGGRKQILLNAYHPSGLTREADQRDFGVGSRRTFTSCEEGILFFGAEYDIEGGQVTDLEFNSKLDFKFFIDVEDYVREKAGTKNTVLKHWRFEIPEEDLGSIPADHGHDFVFIYEVEGGERHKTMYFRQLSEGAFGVVPLTYSVDRFEVLSKRAVTEEKFRKRALRSNVDLEQVREIFPDTPYENAGASSISDEEGGPLEKADWVVIGKTLFRGQYPREHFRGVVREHMDELRHCLDGELSVHPETTGKMNIRVLVGERGQVMSATALGSNLGSKAKKSKAQESGEIESKEFKGCVERAFARWTFPAPETPNIHVLQQLRFMSK